MITSITTVNIYGRNVRGRDLVVGDIHGCFSQLEERLKAINFSPAVDRLFAVGDLVDRGPESPRALEFLAKPWFLPVRGNHEQMFLDLYQGGEPNDDVLEAVCRRNGMNWWISQSDEARRSFLRAFAKIPIAAEINTVRGAVGLVHADVPAGMHWREFLRRISAGDQAATDVALWSRERILKASTSGVEGIDRLFVGHTIGDRVRQLGNVYFVDSGAFIYECGALVAEPRSDDGGVTIASLVAGTASLRGARFNAPELSDTSLVTHFGQYTTPSSPR